MSRPMSDDVYPDAPGVTRQVPALDVVQTGCPGLDTPSSLPYCAGEAMAHILANAPEVRLYPLFPVQVATTCGSLLVSPLPSDRPRVVYSWQRAGEV